MADAVVVCPFCGFKKDSDYAIQLHIEEHHTEDSPFASDNATPMTANGALSSESMPTNEWTKCTRPGCGEYVLLSDIDEHLDIHEATAASEGNAQKSASPRKPSRNASARDVKNSPRKLQRNQAPNTNGRIPGISILDYFSGTSHHGPSPRRRLREPREPGRLGRRELGPHAFERNMPADIRRHLLNDAIPYLTNRIGRDGRLEQKTVVANETSGLMPVLADLCALDRSTEATYLCDPSVKHVLKLRCDGNFCGYWNIQMLLSYLKHNGNSQQQLPNVLEIQDDIERAWDNGTCAYGRIETGGVRGTRKWIGTHEALAYFTQIGVKVEALSFKDDDAGSSQPALIALLDHVEAYFISGLVTKQHGTSRITNLAPLYFQRFGHSMTIVGLERKEDGSRNLLVFDPSFATAASMERLLDGRKTYAEPDVLLRAYRRSDVSLSRWEEFEVVVPEMPVHSRTD